MELIKLPLLILKVRTLASSQASQFCSKLFAKSSIVASQLWVRNVEIMDVRRLGKLTLLLELSDSLKISVTHLWNYSFTADTSQHDERKKQGWDDFELTHREKGSGRHECVNRQTRFSHLENLRKWKCTFCEKKRQPKFWLVHSLGIKCDLELKTIVSGRCDRSEKTF